MAVDQAAAGGDEAGGVPREPSEGHGRLGGEAVEVVEPGPGDVPEALDRVHRAADVTSLPSRVGGRPRTQGLPPTEGHRVPFAAVANPSPDLLFTPLAGKSKTVAQLLTTFHLVFVALDPYEEPSSWILPTARRVLANFKQADCRVSLLVTASADDAALFLGPIAKEVQVFVDPDRTIVKGFGLSRLPALVHLGMDGTVVGAAEGWQPSQWRAVADRLAEITGWTAPTLPGPKDPGPFSGTPAY